MIGEQTATGWVTMPSNTMTVSYAASGRLNAVVCGVTILRVKIPYLHRKQSDATDPTKETTADARLPLLSTRVDIREPMM